MLGRALAKGMVRPMRNIMFATALIAGVFNPYAPPTIDRAKLNADLVRLSAKLNTGLAKFSKTSVAFINTALTPVTPEAAPIDASASAKIDEDLDYRIAEQRKSADAWRAFLTAHPTGAHAPAAQAALDKLEPPPAPPVSEVALNTLNTPSQQLEFFRLMERSSADAPETAPTTSIVEVPVPETKTIVKWREYRTVIYRRAARHRYYRSEPPSMSSFLLALFGQQRLRGGR
jgi:hypothetical protein